MNKIFIFIVATIFLSPCGVTATLHDACRSGNLKEVEKLINSGANVGAINHYGWTPLHMATCYGHEGIVKLLINSGVEVDAKKNDDWNPLLLASSHGREGIVRLLTAAPLLLKQSNSVNSQLSKETLNKLDDYCVGYSREVFNLQLAPNKNFKFFKNLPVPAMESIVDYILPIKNYIESRYLKAFLKLCYQDTYSLEPLAFANLFIHELYKNHLLELKLYITIKNNDNKTAIDKAREENKNNIVTYLETIEKARDYGELEEDLRKKTETNYKQLVKYNG